MIRRVQLKDSGRALSSEFAQGEQYACPICRDVHYVHPLTESGKVDYSIVVPCLCVREQLERERMQNLLRYCELPAGTAHMTFENFRVSPRLREAYDLAVQAAEETSGIAWLTMMAGTDRGKTHLAIAICRRWLQRGKPARYAYVPLLLEELRRGFREEGDRSYEARFDRFLNVPLLVLDDLGTENRTDWVQEKLDTIIDYRLVQGLPLVATTNTPLDELPFRIASRLKRAPGSRVAVIDAPEFRKSKKGSVTEKALQDD
ncbi:hypothetical protein ES703_24966 [subsurface metagenome]